MPKAGCPNNWFDGRRFHDDTNGNLIDRKVYDSLHLAGWVSKEGKHNFPFIETSPYSKVQCIVQSSKVKYSTAKHNTAENSTALQYSIV